MPSAADSREPRFTREAVALATGLTVDQLRRRLRVWVRPPDAPADEFLLREVIAEATVVRLRIKGDRADRVRLSFRDHDVTGSDYVVIVDKNGFAIPIDRSQFDDYPIDLKGSVVFDPRPVLAKLGLTPAKPDTSPQPTTDQRRLFPAPAEGELPFDDGE